jgi:hypothetical protein
MFTENITENHRWILPLVPLLRFAVGTLGKNGSRANVGMADCWLIYKKITNLE